MRGIVMREREPRGLPADRCQAAQPRCDELVNEVASMAEAFSATAQRLPPAMTRLLLPGEPLPESLIGELLDQRRRFEAIRAQVVDLGAALGIACPATESLGNLGRL